jgi:hypothetical protein
VEDIINEAEGTRLLQELTSLKALQMIIRAPMVLEKAIGLTDVRPF